MAGEKFTVTISAKIKSFIANMKKASKAVTGLGMKNRGLTKGVQEMSSSFAKSGKRFGQTSQKFQNGISVIGKSTTGLNKKLAGASKGFSKFAVAGLAVAGVVGTIAAAFFGLRKALNFAEIGAAFQVQARAFANLVANQGVNAEKLVTQLKIASKGTLDTMAIITTASRALLLGIPASRLTELMQVARRAAKAMGTTVAGAFSDIALGIGRQSRLILDNLGIIVRVGVAYENYARKIGTTAGALTDFEKRQAFLNETLEQAKRKFSQSSKDVKDFRDRMDQLRALGADATKRIALAMLVPFIALAETLADLGIGEQIKDFFNITIPETLVESLELFIQFLKAIRDTKDFLVPSRDAIQRLFDFTGISYASEKVNAALRFLGVGVKKVVKATIKANAEVEALEKATQAPATVAKEKGFLSTFTDNIEKAKNSMAGFADSLFGAGGDRPSLVEVALKNVISLNNALDDTVSKASDIQKEFSIGLPLIEKGVKSLTEQIEKLELAETAGAIGPTRINELRKQREELAAELTKLQAQQANVVGPESFLEGIGLQSDKRFLQQAKVTVEKMERLVKLINKGIITNPQIIADASKRLFKDIEANFEFLPPALQARALEIRKILQGAIPTDTIRKGLNQWVDDFNDTKNRLQTIGKSMAESLSKGFDDFFFNAITGKLNSLKDAFDSMFKSMLRSLTKFLGDKATQEFLGLAFGATGSKTKSNIGPTPMGGIFGAISGLFKKSGGGSATPAGFVGPPAPGGGGGGWMSSLFGGLGKLLGFADGGIADFVGNAGSGVVSTPTLAAIAEKPGKKEAVMPLEKFTDLVQPVTLNINAIDARSFQQYMNDNKEMVLGTIMGIKGSRVVDGFSTQQRGPF